MRQFIEANSDVMLPMELLTIRTFSSSVYSSSRSFNNLLTFPIFNEKPKIANNEIFIFEPDNQKSINKTKSIRRLDMIQKMEKDWNGYGAEPIPKDIIDLSRNIVVILDYQPNIFPTARRSIQMEYRLIDKSYLEFEIFANHISILEVPQRIYSKAIEKEISAKNYRQLSLIVSNFYGGIAEWDYPQAM